MTPHQVSAGELRNASISDLQHEIEAKRMHLAKMRMSLKLKSEKDTAQYRGEKKEFARLFTVLAEKQNHGEMSSKHQKKGKTALKAHSKASKVRVPQSSSSDVGSPAPK